MVGGKKAKGKTNQNIFYHKWTSELTNLAHFLEENTHKPCFSFILFIYLQINNISKGMHIKKTNILHGDNPDGPKQRNVNLQYIQTGAMHIPEAEVIY